MLSSAVIEKEISKLKMILDECYPFFSTVSDGSPVGADAECLIVRAVDRKTHCIRQVLISVRLYDKKLSGEQIASNILLQLGRFNLEPNYWRGSMMDRASTNIKAIKMVKEVTQYSPTLVPCLSHTTSLPGKEFKNTCKLMHNFRKAFNASIMFRGKMSSLFKEHFGFAPKVAGGVRWYLEWEQINEIDQIGVDSIMNKLIPVAEVQKISEKSVAKMNKIATKEKMGKLIVEFAAVAEAGRPFCTSTYLMEGDDPLVFGAHLELKKLQDYIKDGPRFRSNSRTQKRCREAEGIINNLCRDLVHSRDMRYEEVCIFEEELNFIQDQLKDTDIPTNNAGGTLRNRGRRVDYASMANGRVRNRAHNANTIEQLADLESEMRAKKAEMRFAEKELYKTEEKLALYQMKLGPLTEEDFMRYASRKVECAFIKGRKLFNEDVDVVRTNKALSACKVFDIIFLRTSPSLANLGLMIDDLSYFNFPELTDEFLQNMKDELPNLLELAVTYDFDFESIDGEGEKYTKRVLTRARRVRKRAIMCEVERRMHRGENNEDVNGIPLNIEEEINIVDLVINEIGANDYRVIEWKNDPGERSRRIYEWWKTIMNGHNSKLKYFSKAVCLIATVQTSSAASERVFSQLNFIRRVVGDRLLQDLLELRCFLRCNNNLGDDYLFMGR